MGPRCGRVVYRSSCICRSSVKRVLRGSYVAVPTFVRPDRTIERKFEHSFGLSSVRYELSDYVGRSVRVLFEVLRFRVVFVLCWSVFRRWFVRYSVCVDAFRCSVPIDFVRAFVFSYYMKRSERWRLYPFSRVRLSG